MRSTSGIQDGTHRSYLGSQRGRLVLQFVSRKPFHPAECRTIRSQFRGIRETRFTTLAGGIQNDNRHCQGGRYHPLPDALSQLVDTIGSVTVYWRFVQVSRFVRRRVHGLQEVSHVVSSAAILAAPVTEGRHRFAGVARTSRGFVGHVWIVDARTDGKLVPISTCPLPPVKVASHRRRPSRSTTS